MTKELENKERKQRKAEERKKKEELKMKQPKIDLINAKRREKAEYKQKYTNELQSDAKE